MVPAVLKVLKAGVHCFEAQATLETREAHIADGFILVVLIEAQLCLQTQTWDISTQVRVPTRIQDISRQVRTLEP